MGLTEGMLEMPRLKVSNPFAMPFLQESNRKRRKGFTKDIGAQPKDLNNAVSLFFITFVIFQPISAAVGRRIGAKNWIPVIMVRFSNRH